MKKWLKMTCVVLAATMTIGAAAACGGNDGGAEFKGKFETVSKQQIEQLLSSNPVDFDTSLYESSVPGMQFYVAGKMSTKSTLSGVTMDMSASYKYEGQKTFGTTPESFVKSHQKVSMDMAAAGASMKADYTMDFSQYVSDETAYYDGSLTADGSKQTMKGKYDLATASDFFSPDMLLSTFEMFYADVIEDALLDLDNLPEGFEITAATDESGSKIRFVANGTAMNNLIGTGAPQLTMKKPLEVIFSFDKDSKFVGMRVILDMVAEKEGNNGSMSLTYWIKKFDGTIQAKTGLDSYPSLVPQLPAMPEI